MYAFWFEMIGNFKNFKKIKSHGRKIKQPKNFDVRVTKPCRDKTENTEKGEKLFSNYIRVILVASL